MKIKTLVCLLVLLAARSFAIPFLYGDPLEIKAYYVSEWNKAIEDAKSISSGLWTYTKGESLDSLPDSEKRRRFSAFSIIGAANGDYDIGFNALNKSGKLVGAQMMGILTSISPDSCFGMEGEFNAANNLCLKFAKNAIRARSIFLDDGALAELRLTQDLGTEVFYVDDSMYFRIPKSANALEHIIRHEALKSGVVEKIQADPQDALKYLRRVAAWRKDLFDQLFADESEGAFKVDTKRKWDDICIRNPNKRLLDSLEKAKGFMRDDVYMDFMKVLVDLDICKVYYSSMCKNVTNIGDEYMEMYLSKGCELKGITIDKAAELTDYFKSQLNGKQAKLFSEKVGRLNSCKEIADNGYSWKYVEPDVENCKKNSGIRVSK